MAKRTKTAASSDAGADPIESDDLPGDTDVIGPWVPSHRDVTDFVNLNKRVLAVTKERSFSAIWPVAIFRAAERTTVSLFIATAAAMNGSMGAWLEVIDFCRNFDLPLPPVISSVISKQYVALFDRRPVWQRDRRIGTPIARLRYEIINSFLDYNRSYINIKKDRAELPLLFSDLCRGAFVPKALRVRDAFDELKNIGGRFPAGAKEIVMVEEKHAVEDYRRVEKDYERMVKPENLSDFEGQEIWPGRHYIPGNDTLKRLGRGDWIELLCDFDILPDRPYFYRAS